MTCLNHPLKRLSFALFLSSAAILVGLALLPAPVEIRSYPEWIDATTSDTPDHHVIRISTACAAAQIGSIEEFAKDFFIVDAFSSKNGISWAMTEMMIERHEPFTIAPTVDLTEKEKAVFFSTLSRKEKLCLKGVCVAKLDAELLASILKICGTSVGQVRKDAYEVQWRISNNLEDTFPWSLVAFLLGIIFLLSSLLYDRTLGPLVKWIRTGSASQMPKPNTSSSLDIPFGSRQDAPHEMRFSTASLERMNDQMNAEQTSLDVATESARPIGGWLVLIGFGLVASVIGNIFNCVKLIQLLAAAQTIKGGIGFVAVMLEVFIQLYMLCASIFLTSLFFKQKHKFKTLFIAYISSLFALGIISVAVTASIPGVAPEIVGQVMAFPIYIFLLGVIWIPYFLRSRRVKETFVC